MEHKQDSDDLFLSPYKYKILDVMDRNIATKVNSTRLNRYGIYMIKSKTENSIDKYLKYSLNFLNRLAPYRFQTWYSCCVLVAIALCMLILSNYSFSFSTPSVSSLKTQLNTPFPIAIVQEHTELDNQSNSTSDFSQVEVQEYTIETGDMLLQLAKKFNRNIDTIVSWNSIRDARRIRAGDTIVIPNKDGVVYTVAHGDTLNMLSNRYGVKAVSILDANNLASNKITTGTKLFIPGAKMNSFELGLVLGTVFLAPTRGRISSYYGYRTSPITGLWSFHGGVDIANVTGTNIIAATYGRVSYVSANSPVYGRMVIIKHPGGFQTLYGHLDKILVRKGQSISRGQVVGTMGNTGLSTGPHLHFTVIHNGITVNPLHYIRF